MGRQPGDELGQRGLTLFTVHLGPGVAWQGTIPVASGAPTAANGTIECVLGESVTCTYDEGQNDGAPDMTPEEFLVVGAVPVDLQSFEIE